MLLRKAKIQLIAFAIISVLAIAYALVRFTDIEKVFGTGGYTVQLELNESGGIFTGAEVTYRGYNIGRVGELSLTETGLKAELDIEPEAPKVPSDLHAMVANRSAVGEQFVDLRPVTDNGPYLADGSVIPAERASTPVPTEKVIGDLDSLASSVPTDALRTVVDESYEAFRGTGDDLQVLMDTTRDFTKVAKQYLPQTVELLNSGNVVLNTQNDLATSMKEFSSDLASVSETLKNSDADIRELIGITPQAANQVSELLAESGPGLGSVVANLLTTSNLLFTRQDGLEQALVTYPVVAGGAFSVAPDDGTAHLGLALNLFNPPSCTKGYRAPEEYRPGDDTTPRPPDSSAYCAEPPGSPINVRGSQNAPYNGVPVQPSEEQVRANSTRDEEELASLRGVPGVAGSPGLSITSLGQLVGLTG
ncbi:ABC transporter substrate-binding protein [Prauserella marina]|uniref:Phospholipid/cholesterol/gamma-HCH transport system substrate-binding protein n=1 Tax=Prauserella marina TaxID=530584 RepID=A0A222VJR6_9PSEU|nr:MCE family protein [Prauserella marina]ASR34072.1 ABC transporter substrate-binding protein [Prauserella marina]PWV82709.1 phospholipid/cholesterol/gamma-HCH transport system substrate-binding protein [Prauserella marina]SDC75326.1 phospholipid/cholesterol/gamma-HCH transport system substrate-binding protein [Prauserella marina]